MLERGLVGLGLLLLGGCFTQDNNTTLVSANPFSSGAPAAVQTHAAFSPASTEKAAWVDMIGRQVLGANKQIGLQPGFETIGAPHAEIFHVGTAKVDITEGLVKQCKTDGQLAAILAVELGKMVSEREAQAGPKARLPERDPPMEVRIGNDSGGSFGAPDLTYQAVLGKYEKERRKPSAAPPPLPDAQSLARIYLTKAGYSEKELEAVSPLLKDAAASSTFEKQMTAPPPSSSFVR